MTQPEIAPALAAWRSFKDDCAAQFNALSDHVIDNHLSDVEASKLFLDMLYEQQEQLWPLEFELMKFRDRLVESIAEESAGLAELEANANGETL